MSDNEYSNESLDPIWKVYGLGFSKKSLDCKKPWFSKTWILKFSIAFGRSTIYLCFMYFSSRSTHAVSV